MGDGCSLRLFFLFVPSGSPDLVQLARGSGMLPTAPILQKVGGGMPSSMPSCMLVYADLLALRHGNKNNGVMERSFPSCNICKFI